MRVLVWQEHAHGLIGHDELAALAKRHGITDQARDDRRDGVTPAGATDHAARRIRWNCQEQNPATRHRESMWERRRMFGAVPSRQGLRAPVGQVVLESAGNSRRRTASSPPWLRARQVRVGTHVADQSRRSSVVSQSVSVMAYLGALRLNEQAGIARSSRGLHRKSLWSWRRSGRGGHAKRAPEADIADVGVTTESAGVITHEGLQRRRRKSSSATGREPRRRSGGRSLAPSSVKRVGEAQRPQLLQSRAASDPSRHLVESSQSLSRWTVSRDVRTLHRSRGVGQSQRSVALAQRDPSRRRR